MSGGYESIEPEGAGPLLKFVCALALIGAAGYYLIPPLRDASRRKAAEAFDLGEGWRPFRDQGRERSRAKRGKRRWGAVRNPLKTGAFAKVSGLYPSIMSIHAGREKGAVWVVSKYGVHRFTEGVMTRYKTYLDARHFKEILGEPAGPNAFASSAESPDGTLWVGGWHGTVIRYADGRWSWADRKGSGPEGKIEQIMTFGDRVFLVGSGLWRWDARKNRFVADERFSGSVVSAAFDAEGNLHAALPGEVRVWTDSGWKAFWRAGKGDKRITRIRFLRDGSLAVGTLNGFVILDKEGAEVRRGLPGRWVTDFAEDGDKGLWAATWKNGLFFNPAPWTGSEPWKKFGTPEGLADDDVYTIFLGPHGRVWAGIYGKGLYTADAAQVVERFAPDDE